MKKFLSIILSAVLLLSAVLPVGAASFSDVKSSSWYYSSVNYVADKGIMQGTSSKAFSPEANLTRAMGVTLIYRLAGSPAASGVSIPFGDVKSGQWYTDAVKWAYQSGVVTGKSSTYFDVDGDITRAEFATILNRYSSYRKYTLPRVRTGIVTDFAEIPDWALAAVDTMYKAGIINGKDDGTFDPNAKITRAEAAAMIERFDKAPKNANNNSGTGDETPPKNPEVSTTGNLVIKEKKYAYGNVDVMILNVENQTSTDIDVYFFGKFMDASGKELKTVISRVNGFPANYRNYVIMEPGVKFAKFSVEVKATKYKDTAYMKYVAFDSELSDVNIMKMSNSNMFGTGTSYEKGKERLGFYVTFNYFNSSERDAGIETNISIPSDMAFIDNEGNLLAILHYTGCIKSGYVGYKSQLPIAEHILYDNWKKPDNFKLSMLVGIQSATLYG
ncbi:MAG: S-layer homology domain-containing protein [Clostridia bacterium]|nr:S-layer homology domain-containing protein [Clostridia bacterium]